MNGPDLFIRRQAELSDCGRFRFRLDRRWAEGQAVCWIMLNPSTADGERDDPTIREIARRTRDWGYGGLVVVNLCPLRSADPRAAAAWHRRVDSGRVRSANATAILDAAWEAGLVIAAWGAHPEFIDDARSLRALLRAGRIRLHHLGLTQGGHPKHPLARGRHRIHRAQKPLPWEA